MLEHLISPSLNLRCGRITQNPDDALPDPVIFEAIKQLALLHAFRCGIDRETFRKEAPCFSESSLVPHLDDPGRKTQLVAPFRNFVGGVCELLSSETTVLEKDVE